MSTLYITENSVIAESVFKTSVLPYKVHGTLDFLAGFLATLTSCNISLSGIYIENVTLKKVLKLYKVIDYDYEKSKEWKSEKFTTFIFCGKKQRVYSNVSQEFREGLEFWNSISNIQCKIFGY